MWTNEGSKRVVPLKEVHFGSLNDVPLNFWGKIPQKLKFWGVNRTFKPEREKIQILITWNYLADHDILQEVGLRTMNEA